MKTFGVSMFKDEADIAEHTIRHMIDEVDGILVADNLSTDGTLEILQKLADEFINVHVVIDDNPAYYQSEKMSDLAKLAHHEYGADWIVPFDADELWYSRDARVRDLCAATEHHILHAPLWNHFPSALDPSEGTPFDTIGWRQREPGALPKVAFSWSEGTVIHQGNHGVTLGDTGRQGSVGIDTGLALRHFPYRSFEQFARKARNGKAAYDATNLPEYQGSHWRGYGRILEEWGEDVLREQVYEKYFWFYSPVDEGMIYDPAPFMRWQRGL